MGQGHRPTRRGATTQRRRRRPRRLLLVISAPLVVAALVAVMVLTGRSTYSGFEVIGKQPAIVQVFLPG
jgi:hypothetical protein